MQFGGTLYRLLYLIRHADPKCGIIYLAKFDLKDGFYRLHLRPKDAPSLALRWVFLRKRKSRNFLSSYRK